MTTAFHDNPVSRHGGAVNQSKIAEPGRPNLTVETTLNPCQCKLLFREVAQIQLSRNRTPPIVHLEARAD